MNIKLKAKQGIGHERGDAFTGAESIGIILDSHRKP